MRKGSDVIDKAIVAFNTGKRIARVQDIIFDQRENQILAFLIDEGGLFRSPRMVPLMSVQAIGVDAIVVPGADAIMAITASPTIEGIYRQNVVVKGTRLLTSDGQYLGTVADLYFDEKSGAIEGYEASGGLFADAYTGRSFIPAPHTLQIGRDITFVPPETANLMQEQVGGLRGAVQTAGTRIQASTDQASQQLQSATQAANERLQQGAQTAHQHFQQSAETANQRLREFARLADERFQQGRIEAASSLTNSLIPPEEQIAYAVGKPSDRDVLTPNGMVLIVKNQIVTLSLAEEAQRLGILDQVYRATGGNVTADINRRLQENAESARTRLQTVAQTLIEQAKGRRAQRMVRDEEGRIIAAPGQIVTDQVIDRAEDHNRIAALLESVGVDSSDLSRIIPSDRIVQAREQFRDQATVLQENANTAWKNLQTEFQRLQKQTNRSIHRRRIEAALGRPVTRVILDPNDNVILNVGELITHRAIAQADQSGVLNILLNSVSTKQPEITSAELRAPEPGMAALNPHTQPEQVERMFTHQ